MQEKVFISYARKDGESHAKKLNADLKAAGYDVWFDQDKEGGIPAGYAWQKAIQEGIDNCDVFLLLVTPASIQSNNCFAEWNRAITHKKTILPLKMKPTDGSEPVALLGQEIGPHADYVTRARDEALR